MKTKTNLFILCLLILPFSQSFGQETQPSLKGIGFGLRISGGMSYLVSGDPNSVISGLTCYYIDRSDYLGWPMEGKFQKLRLGLDFEAQGILYLNPSFGLCLGAGYLHGKIGESKNVIEVTGPAYDEIFTEEILLQAIPVKLGVLYSLPLASQIRMFISGQAVYYFAELSEVYRYEWNGSWYTYAQKAKGSGLGFQGGLGLEFILIQNLGFFLEGQGRYGRIKGLDGALEMKTSDGFFQKTEGRLYYYETQIYPGPGKWYPQMYIQEEEPNSDKKRDVREARIDLSGAAMTVGVFIRF
jgi:hypothetical protein